MTEACADSAEVLILGAGPVGLTLHLALARYGITSRLLERRPLAALQADPRVLALSHGTRELLEQLDSWPAQAATPIETIHISQRGGFGRCLMTAKEQALPALGYVVRYRDLVSALSRHLAPDALYAEAEMLALEEDAQGVGLKLGQNADSVSLHGALIVHADGTPGADPLVSVRDYHQQAVICEVRPAQPHGQRAWERFTPDGPLALLPLGEEFSVVLTLPPAKAKEVMALDDAAFIAALEAQFGRHLGLCQASPRNCFPLALRMRRTLAQGRAVWIGNAAQTLHPVSGQGFNLGLRDAWQLAQTLLTEGCTPSALAHYARLRRCDRQGGALFTDTVVRTFSTDFAPIKWARGLGLYALDLFPPARQFVARRMIWGGRGG
ncbi:FAD-dependent monooxygenase [Azonexus sp.]|uniref:FAD-dependent monooxygenase n=1 Tax=Azonexus sp. TaxID=1872668 RepID=UPI0039E49DC2